MKSKHILYLLTVIFFMASCHSSKISVQENTENYKPADKVEILIKVPEESYTVIARMELEGPLNMYEGVPDILEKLKKEALKRGADAIIPTEEGIKRHEEEQIYSPWVVDFVALPTPYQTVAVNAIIYDSLKYDRMILEKPEEVRIAAGLQFNGIAPFYNGYGGSIWLGEDHYRTTATFVRMEYPGQVINGPYDGEINFATRVDIDYFLNGFLKGPYFGVGLQYGRYEYSRFTLSSSGNHYRVDYSLSLGYKQNIWRGIHIDARLSGNGNIYGRSSVTTAPNWVYEPTYFMPFASLALGWEF